MTDLLPVVICKYFQKPAGLVLMTISDLSTYDSGDIGFCFTSSPRSCLIRGVAHLYFHQRNSLMAWFTDKYFIQELPLWFGVCCFGCMEKTDLRMDEKAERRGLLCNQSLFAHSLHAALKCLSNELWWQKMDGCFISLRYTAMSCSPFCAHTLRREGVWGVYITPQGVPHTGVPEPLWVSLIWRCFRVLHSHTHTRGVPGPWRLIHHSAWAPMKLWFLQSSILFSLCSFPVIFICN